MALSLVLVALVRFLFVEHFHGRKYLLSCVLRVPAASLGEVRFLRLVAIARRPLHRREEVEGKKV